MTEEAAYDGTCLLYPIMAIGKVHTLGTKYHYELIELRYLSKGYNEVLLEASKYMYHSN